MKKLLFSILVLSAVIGFQGCSEDFEVAAPYKHITLVYGLLNITDTAHYIRVQKAFMDENKSAIEMAKEADSNFYKEADINVVVKEMNGAFVTDSIVLKRVDMNAEGYPKDSGVFFNAPNYAYKFKKALNPARTYRLEINNHLTNELATAEIAIVDTTKLKMRDVESGGIYLFIFGQTVPPNSQNSKYTLSVNPGNANYIEGIIRFHWIDSNTSTHTSIKDSADFLFDSKIVEKTSELLEITNISFFNFLRNNMQAADPGVERYMDSCDFFLYGGGIDYGNYLTVTQLQSGGLTADQIKPIYTNLKGKDVYGLFSSRAFKMRRNIAIESSTLDSLKQNPVTMPLNIKGRTKN